MNDNNAMQYEFLIRRAFNCERFKKGADADIFRALYREEYEAREKPLDRRVQNAYEKRKQNIRVYLTKALEKAISRLAKRKDKIQVVDELRILIDNVNASNNSDQFSSVISQAMVVFIEHDISWIT